MNRIEALFKKENTWYIVTFLFLVVLCYLFPYTGDDWTWGSSIGMDRLNSGFSDYGGRYFGYIIVMVLTRFRLLKALIMAGTLVGISWGVRCIVKQKWAFFASLLLMFLVSREIFAQSISWASGFANYATTAAMIVAFLAIVFNIILEKKEEPVWLKIGMAVLGLSGSLIMENVTVFFVIMPILLQIYLWKKEKRFSVALFLFMLGAVAGAVLMFTNSAYTNIASAQDGYRTMSFSITELIARAKENYMTAIHPYGLFKNVVLIVTFAVGGLLLLGNNKEKRNRMAMISLTVVGVFTLINVLSNVIIGTTYKPKIFIYLEALASLIAIVAFAVFTYSVTEKKSKERRIVTILWLSFAILIGPLFVVTPVGPRNFFSPYILLVIICLMVWKDALEPIRNGNKRLVSWLERGVKYGAVLTIGIYVCIFMAVYYVDVSRLNYIRREVDAGSKRVELRKLPFNDLMWVSSPTFDKYTERYKMFYDIPMDVDVVNEWVSE